MSDLQIFDEEFIEVFRDEYVQHVRQLDELILKISRKPDDKKLIDELRRILHSVKGMFGTIGQVKLQEITHALEDMVLATPATGLSKSTLENLNQYLGVLRDVVQLMLTSKSFDFDVDPLLSSFKATEELWVKISRKFKITVKFETNTPMLSARALVILRNLKTIAQIISSNPTEDELDSEELGYFDELIVEISTFEDEERIEQLLSSLPAVKKVFIQPIVLETDVSVPIERVSIPMEMQTIAVKLKDLLTLSNMLGEVISVGHVIDDIVSRVQKLSEAEQEAIANFRKYILDMETLLTKLRLVPFRTITRVLPRVANDLARELGKEVRIYISGEDIGVDRAVVETLLEPMTQLVRNAIIHGIENPDERKHLGKSMSGAILIRASYVEGSVEIEVTDDGRGIDLEEAISRAKSQGLIPADVDSQALTLNDILFLPGFTTKTETTKTAGRGYGLNAIQEAVKRIGGSIVVESVVGQGTTFRLLVPITTSIVRTVIFKVKDLLFAIPTSEVESIKLISSHDLEHDSELITELRKTKHPFISALYKEEDNVEDHYPVIDFSNILRPSFSLDNSSDQKEAKLESNGSVTEEDLDRKPLILWRRPPYQFGLIVDELIDAQELYIKPLDKHVLQLPFINGAATYGASHAVFMIDPSKI